MDSLVRIIDVHGSSEFKDDSRIMIFRSSSPEGRFGHFPIGESYPYFSRGTRLSMVGIHRNPCCVRVHMSVSSMGTMLLSGLGLLALLIIRLLLAELSLVTIALFSQAVCFWLYILVINLLLPVVALALVLQDAVAIVAMETGFCVGA